MNAKATLLISLALVCSLCSIHAQERVEVSPPSLSLENGKVHIRYQILNVNPSETFTTRIEVTNQSGERIAARSLAGDIGEGIGGSGSKLIVWDIEADSIFLDEEIFVEVFARPEKLPLAEREATANTEAENIRQGPKEAAEKMEEASEELNRTSLILQSVAFPGLGLSRLHTGQPHWIRGVAAYACLAGSVYMNQKAWNSYQLYLEPSGIDEVQDLFDQAYDQKKRSRILAYTAAGVWVLDLAWTILGTSGMNKDQVTTRQKGLTIGTGIEPLTNTPLLALCYRF